MSKTLSVIASCTSSSQGRRSKQEDAICCHRVMFSNSCGSEAGQNGENVSNQPDKERSFLLAGVFDGHGGAEVATHASNLLEQAVLRAWSQQTSAKHVSGSGEKNRLNLEKRLGDGAFIGDVLRRALISLDFSLFVVSLLVPQESSSQPEKKRRQRRNHASVERDEDVCDMYSPVLDLLPKGYCGEEKYQNTKGLGGLGGCEVEVSRSLHHDRTATEENEDDYSFFAQDKNQASHNTRYLRNLLDVYDSEDEWNGSSRGEQSTSEPQLSKTAVAGHLRGAEKEPFSIALSRETGTDAINFKEETVTSDQTCEAPLSALISPNSEGNAPRNLAFFCDSRDSLCDASKSPLAYETSSMDVCTTSRHQEGSSDFSGPALLAAGAFTEKIKPFAPPRVLPPVCCLSHDQGVKLHTSRWSNGSLDPRCSALMSLSSSPVIPRAKQFPPSSALVQGAATPNPRNMLKHCRSAQPATCSTGSPLPQTHNNDFGFQQRKQPTSRFDRSGTTVSATIVTEKGLINASLGDSKSIVLRLKGPPTLEACGKLRNTKGPQSSWIKAYAEILLDGPQHRLDNPAEKLRLGRFQSSPLFAQFCESHPEQCSNLQQSLSSNQTVSSLGQCDEGAASRSVSPLSDSLVTDGRLLGQLNVSRGLGDFSLKHIPNSLWGEGIGEKESDAATTETLHNPIGPMGNCCDVFIYSAEDESTEHDSEKSAAFQPTIILTLSATDGLWDAIRPPSIATAVQTSCSTNSSNGVHRELAPLLAYLESHQHFREFVVTAWEKAISHHASRTISSDSNDDMSLVAKEPPFSRVESSTDIANVHFHLTSPCREDPLSLPSVGVSGGGGGGGGGGLSDTAIIIGSEKGKRRGLPPCERLSDSDTAHVAVLPRLQPLFPLNPSPKMSVTLSQATTPLDANNNKLIVELHEEHPTLSSSCPTPRGDSLNGILQKIADDLVAWAVHDKSSSDNVSVILVAADVR